MDIDIRDDREEQQDGALLELASMIDDDQPIDWNSEELEARGAGERAVLAELRLLAALTRVYRDPDAVGLESTPRDRGAATRRPARYRPRRGHR